MKPVDAPTNITDNAPVGSLADMVNKVGNANVNYTGSPPKMGAAKSEAMGKDTGPHATNSMGKFDNKEHSPSATCVSSGHMQRGKKKGY
jgi:hypothetical protein